jgi:flagellar hook-associated protein 3 FlgL
MNRVSTAGNYAITLANLTQSQLRQIEAGRQVSSQKNAGDLKGYSGKSETLTAMQAVKSKVDALIDQNATLSDRYATQDVALNQISDATQAARQAIVDALASGRADTLMQDIGNQFGDVVAGLNTKSQGKYLFAGGQINTPPVSATSISDLTAGPALSTFFHNDTFVASNQIDENSSIQGGKLASDLGQNLMQGFKDIQAFNDGASGPFTGALTDAQKTFLTSQLAVFDARHTELINAAAQNGSVIKRLEDAGTALANRSSGLEGMIGGITDTDMAAAIARLQASGLAIQASAQVFTALQGSSLINFLPAG